MTRGEVAEIRERRAKSPANERYKKIYGLISQKVQAVAVVTILDRER